MKDDFLAISSHDLRGPLGAIRGFAELLQDDNTSNADVKQFSNHIPTCSDSLLNRVNDLLDLGKIESENEKMELEPLILSKTIVGSVAGMKTLADTKGIVLKLEDRSPAVALVKGNASAMMRIFNNRVSNAIKFTPKDGKVSVTLEPENGGGQLALTVSDSGIGMSADKIPLLFQKYSKVSRPGTAGERGTGLGPPIVKELVAKQGGTISATSKEGQGSSFRVVFLLAQ